MNALNPKLDYSVTLQSRIEKILSGLICLSIASGFLVFWIDTAALRELTAGFDTFRYAQAYLSLDTLSSAWTKGGLVYGNSEFLWWPLQYPFSNIGLTASEWIFTISIISIILTSIAYFYILNKNWYIAFIFSAFVFCTYYGVYAGNAIRQVISIPLCFICVHYFFNKNNKKFILFSMLAIGTHWSSLSILLIPILSYLRINIIKHKLTIPTLSLFFSFSLEILLTPIIQAIGLEYATQKFNLYITNSQESHITSITGSSNFWYCSFLYILFSLSTKQYLQKNLQFIIITYFSLILIGLNFPSIADRFFPFILFLSPLIIQNYLLSIKLSKGLSLILNSFIHLFMAFLVYSQTSTKITLGY